MNIKRLLLTILVLFSLSSWIYSHYNSNQINKSKYEKEIEK